ncbi:selenocysteine lyase [Candidatus Nitrososphaera evergladensis SR1]|jgi:cysteine desulfurase/selenocysteine lyase|uniref:Selenocysteine lyase n=1 Tax=Candidatus Nitrososphaera evergladensis SR1 TaxID=1459636 RepID=A0A075MQB0_9ARCH|nr:aminotransferase class V-fold PLP-dependent enzyme [Candidatus Nitrososphaera evergladensis]AIF83260.1 selenocysteine lyase [Candidatus Nitrososphaera evergladensis SR1]
MTAVQDASPDLRLDFPITKKTIYMNNGAVAPTPLAVVKATTDFMVKCADEGPDAQATSDYITSLLKELRTRVAHLINCEPEEVVLTQSTTEGINIVANGISWKKGDTIIARGGKHEHPANYLPWLRLSQKGTIASLKELVIDENGFFDLAELEKAAKGSRLVTMSHALYNTGAIMPLEEVGSIVAGENNALFCVDAAQTAGTIKIDVKKIGCHFMAFPGFKWLCGPMGIGVLYCSKKAAEALEPPSIGGESAIVSDSGIIAAREMPHRLQTGFRNYPGAAGLEAALRYVLRVGIDNIRSANMKVAEALREELGRIQGVTLYGPQDAEKRTSIVTFSVPKDPSMIVRKLEEENRIVLAEREAGGRRKIIRAAPHFFNTEAEAATVAAQIKALLG